MATTGVLPMKEESVTDALLREFLLGKLADEDRERIEGLFLTDSPTRERVLALEQDLIDDYLEDSLSQGDKERFLSRYAQTDEQRRKLRITGAIKDWAVREARAPHPAAPTVSGWSRFWTWLRLKPRFVVPIAVTIVIAAVLAIVWLNSRTEQRKHFAVEQELAQLNSPTSLREFSPEMASFDLRPVSVRSIKPQAELKIPAEIRFVELQLPWIQNERYSMYQAEVRRLGDRESFTISNLQAENNGRYTIKLRLPARMLTSGDYQITLTGISTDGSAKSSEEYSFVVVN
jgi:hypothetical protein